MARGVYVRTKYVDASIPAFKVAIEAFNSPTNPYRYENSFILMVNAIELLSKALLLKCGQKIDDRDPDRTIPAEKAISKLRHINIIEDIEHQALQQLISLRNEAVHSYIGSIDPDLVFFLMFSSYQYYKRIVEKYFKNKKVLVADNYLSIANDQNKTYVESVINLMKSKRDGDRRILYLLERGVQYDGTDYISQDKFEKEFKNNKRKRLENKAAIGKFVSEAEMLRIVFVQAPKNYSVDVTLGRNQRTKNILPVHVTTRLECDKNTHEIADLVGVRPYDVQKFIRDNDIKGNQKYHQEIPNGISPSLHRYSVKLVHFIKKKGIVT